MYIQNDMSIEIYACKHTDFVLGAILCACHILTSPSAILVIGMYGIYVLIVQQVCIYSVYGLPAHYSYTLKAMAKNEPPLI